MMQQFIWLTMHRNSHFCLQMYLTNVTLTLSSLCLDPLANNPDQHCKGRSAPGELWMDGCLMPQYEACTSL